MRGDDDYGPCPARGRTVAPCAGPPRSSSSRCSAPGARGLAAQPEGAAADCGPDAGTAHYVVFDDAAWTFKEAVDYPEDLGPLAAVESSLDWYGEYERFVPGDDLSTVEGLRLRLSGHLVAIDDHRSELTGATMREATIAGVPALTGVGQDGAPALVTMAVADSYTLMALSYGLDVDELVAIAGELRSVCEPEWIESGGQLLDCLPTGPGCIPPP